jgi:hypothetical protein
MGKVVDHDEVWLRCHEAGDVELRRKVTVCSELIDLLLGPRTSAGLDARHCHVGAALAAPASLVEHGVGLPHPRSSAQVDAEHASDCCRRHDHSLPASAVALGL